MTYTVPPPKAEAKARLVVVEDPAEIAAIQRAGFKDPIGHCEAGVWYAERDSLTEYRKSQLTPDAKRPQ